VGATINLWDETKLEYRNYYQKYDRVTAAMFNNLAAAINKETKE
jgi:hypothetical protein